MQHGVPSLEDVCCHSLLQFSSTTKGVLQDPLPGRIRTCLVRRIILEGRVTSLVAALSTWPEHTLTVGDLCCRDPILFGHNPSLETRQMVPQLLEHSLDGVRSGLSSLCGEEQRSLPVPFLCARYLEVVVNNRHARLRHLDLTFYGLVSLPDMVPVMDALEALYQRDMRAGLAFTEPCVMSVSVAFSSACSSREPLEASAKRLARLLQLQALRTTRCQLRVAGLHSETVDGDKTPRRLLKLLARHRCPLHLLLAHGPGEWWRSSHMETLSSFPRLRLLGRLARGLSLMGCAPAVASRLMTAFRPPARLRSLSVSSNLLCVLGPAKLVGLRRLTLGLGHGAVAERAGDVERLLRSAWHLVDQLRVLLGAPALSDVCLYLTESVPGEFDSRERLLL
ncbi:uncharacterized protein LOC119091445 [Pollicipes pollicipes]|uniref:uncharacterized protein LOC119091445 n=1 Tax=Pollicipes pollicipes TaxID=41117 RepID=UPI001884E7F0|nr:uncharacterized protein LOC119091445 [Pollicipes pollicipes]